MLRQDIAVSPILILAPKSVCNTWLKEVEKFGEGLKAAVCLNNPIRTRVTNIQRSAHINAITITSYETTSRIPKGIFNTVICDESTRIKNIKAARSKGAYNLGSTAEFRWILTGSPVPKGIEDIYGQIYFLDRGNRLGKDYWTFLQRYFNPVSFGGGKQAWKATPTGGSSIRNAIREIVFYRNRAQCVHLPEKRYSIRTCEMSLEVRSKTNRIIEMWRNEERETNSSLAVDAWLRMVATGFSGDWEAIPCNKYDVLNELCEDTEIGDQIIIWCWFREERNRIAQMLQHMKIPFINIGGETSLTQRSELLGQFERKEVRIAVISIAVGAFGLNELRDADLIVYFGQTYDLELRKQSEDRSYRVGRITSPTYIDILTQDSIEEHIYDVLMRKELCSEAFLRAEVFHRMGLNHEQRKTN
ncbi:MAG: DEAD/DEAH box helicase [Magnetococcus sp. WYHC-3]